MGIDTAVTGATAARSSPEIFERPAVTVPGRLALGVIALVTVGGIWLVSAGVGKSATSLVALGAVLLVVAFTAARGLVPVAPGEARVVQLFGRYAGTIRDDGLRWVQPAARTRKISTRIRNHETGVAKVNDADGVPIEIAAVVVWQVEDTARAVFGVDEFTGFVAVQAETAVRQVATGYPYDDHGDGRLSLRDSTGEVTTVLASEIVQRVEPAGVKVIEARFTRLAYAPEIAHAMLRRQQAVAVVAARQKIVDGAVGMVEAALARLEADDLLELDAERKAAMVSNMLVVLCSDHPTQPVINTGTLYQ